MRSDAGSRWAATPAFALLALVVLGAGCDRSGPYDPATHGEPAEGYQPLPRGCPPGPSPSGVPELPMPWGTATELFLPSASAVSGFALDYWVNPLAVVHRLDVDFVFEVEGNPATITMTGECPSTLAPSAYVPEGVSNEVVRTRITASGPESPSRYAWLGYPVGWHVYRLPLEAIPVEERSGTWFVVYAPRWGADRIALLPVTLGGDEVVVPGLPDGPAHLALIRTTHVTQQAPHAVYEAAPGFSGLWPVMVEAWYGALVELGRSTPVELTAYRRPGDAVGWAPLLEDTTLAFDASKSVRLASYRGEPFDSVITVPCDGLSRIEVPFAAHVGLSLDGQTVDLVGGGAAPLDPACSGTGTVDVAVHIDSVSTSGWLVVRGP